jgi:hypothetical protein
VTVSSASGARSASPAATTGVRHAAPVPAIILVSYFMMLPDNSIFTALPETHAAMRFSPAGLAWVQDAYRLVLGGLLLLGARAGDLLPPPGARLRAGGVRGGVAAGGVAPEPGAMPEPGCHARARTGNDQRLSFPAEPHADLRKEPR